MAVNSDLPRYFVSNVAMCWPQLSTKVVDPDFVDSLIHEALKTWPVFSFLHPLKEGPPLVFWELRISLYDEAEQLFGSSCLCRSRKEKIAIKEFRWEKNAGQRDYINILKLRWFMFDSFLFPAVSGAANRLDIRNAKAKHRLKESFQKQGGWANWIMAIPSKLSSSIVVDSLILYKLFGRNEFFADIGSFFWEILAGDEDLLQFLVYSFLNLFWTELEISFHERYKRRDFAELRFTLRCQLVTARGGSVVDAAATKGPNSACEVVFQAAYLKCYITEDVHKYNHFHSGAILNDLDACSLAFM